MMMMSREVLEQYKISRDIKMVATDIDRDAILQSKSWLTDTVAGDIPRLSINTSIWEDKLQI